MSDTIGGHSLKYTIQIHAYGLLLDLACTLLAGATVTIRTSAKEIFVWTACSPSTWEAKSFRIRNSGTTAKASTQVTDPELREEHYAYVLDIADRLGLPPDVVAPVFRETLRTLAAGATVETYVVLLAAKKTLTKLRSVAGANRPFHGDH